MGMIIDEIANMKRNRMNARERNRLREALRHRRPLEIAGQKIRWAIARRDGRLVLHLAVSDLCLVVRNALGMPGKKAPANIWLEDSYELPWRWLSPRDTIKNSMFRMVYSLSDLDHVIRCTALWAGKSGSEAKQLSSLLKKQLHNQIEEYKKEGVFA